MRCIFLLLSVASAGWVETGEKNEQTIHKLAATMKEMGLMNAGRKLDKDAMLAFGKKIDSFVGNADGKMESCRINPSSEMGFHLYGATFLECMGKWGEIANGFIQKDVEIKSMGIDKQADGKKILVEYEETGIDKCGDTHKFPTFESYEFNDEGKIERFLLTFNPNIAPLSCDKKALVEVQALAANGTRVPALALGLVSAVGLVVAMALRFRTGTRLTQSPLLG